eukprot:m.134393 g.134393  ORF g.134393 m.134393 type:complete len:77 (-) comp22529_c0_seq1:524-754(-)
MFQSNPDDPESDYEVEEAELQPHKSKPRTEHLEKQPQAKAGSIWAGAAAQQHCRICHVDCTGLDSCPACKAFVQLR